MRRTLAVVLSIPLLAFGLATSLTIGATAAGAVTTDSAVFINEFHYDNSGGDVGEFFEIAGPAGTDLTGWNVELYNGSNGTVYNTISLDGVIDDEGSGFGAVATTLPSNGLQNGSPDGIALVAPGDLLVQFLSYEGEFTATSGAANGQTSTDIGVSESSSAAIGESLQLTGSGDSAFDFAWQAPAAESPGTINAGQTLGGATVPTVFLSEFHYDNTGTDSGEFVEVTGPAGTDLSGYTVMLYNGSNGTVYNEIALSGTIDDEDGTSGAVDLQLPTNGLQNGSPDGIALVAPGDVLVEFLSYEGSFTAVGGPADGLTSTDVGVSEASTTPIGQSLQLIGGVWTGPAAESPGVLNTAPIPDVFISEFHYDNDGGDVGEFVEVTGPAGTDLTGWTIQPYNGSNGTPYSTTALSGVIDDEDGTSGAVSFPISGLQNGSPDGIALVAPGDVLVEFLSYEGSFTAVGGPADGLTSTDVGVSEASTTPIGQSLQLIGGVWTGPAAESPGVLNTAPIPDVFISEFHYDNDGGDVGEFVEVTGPAGTDLTGWTIQPYNGSNGTPYSTTALSGVIDDEDGTSGAVSFPISGLQNGSPDGIALVAPGDVLVEFLSYEGDFTAVGSAADGQTSTDVGVAEGSSTPIGQSLQLVDGIWTGPIAATEGVLNSVTAPDDCAAGTIFIHEIQGSDTVSSCVGDTVTVTGIVTSLFERDDVSDGFFLQEEDADADADAATSEGIFVFCRGACPTVAPGDQMTVTGEVAEFFGMTQIDAAFGSGVFVAGPTGQPLPTPTPIDLPAGASTLAEATFEPVEGMLVRMSDTLVVSEYFQLARFGQVVLTDTSRPFQFTHTNLPSASGYTAFLADLATRRIILDDDNNDQNDAIFDGPDEAYYQPGGGLSNSNVFRGGDTIDNLTAVMHWSFAGSSGTDAWRLRPIPEVYDYSFSPVNTRPPSPDDVGGRLTAVSFNVLNYFTTLDEPGAVCGPSGIGCRGAHSPAEFERQEAKIVAALLETDADIVGLVEIENNASASLQALVDALNAAAGPGTYDFVDTGTIGGDAIKVGLLYQPASVAPVGPVAILDSSVDARFIDTKNRPMLTQTFEEVATGARMNVSVNHLKSKGSPCDDVGDPGTGDGSGNCNGVRTDAAAAIVDFLAGDPTGQGDPDHLILGDLNAYKKETPITTLTGAGYTDLIEQFEGPNAYSFVFDGQIGYLDYALANQAMTPQITGVDEWHINADEVNVFDYNDNIQDPAEASFERISEALPIYAPDAYRSSDHDPVLVGISLAIPEPVYECGSQSFTVSELEALGYNVILGTDGNDTLFGSDDRDAMLGLAGNDRLHGRDADDLLCGGTGSDRLFGQNGNDTLNGDAGNDRLHGGRGDDVLNGDAGNDRLFGGNQADTLNGGEGNDRLYGANGEDVLNGDAGDDRLYGGNQADTLDGGSDRDLLYGGGGDDQLDGGSENDTGFGNSGFDTCVNLETAFSCEA